METNSCRTAIYLRLSRDDGNDESQSIQSQRKILTDYVKRQNWILAGEYVDDGFSGVSFERPDFRRLVKDIEYGRYDIVVTKDLSRLGRSYIQVGYYLEEFFPSHNIRFIALHDNVDSTSDSSDEFAPFRNVINEWYVKDASRKIRTVLNEKAKHGEARNTVFPIFGYMYNDKYERIPDPETAPIVQLIFRKYVETGSCGEVIRILKENKIKTPRYYNAVKYNYNKNKVLAMNEEKFYDWQKDAIRDIIRRDEYLGVYRTAATTSLNYKNKKRYDNKDCYVFENRYEPLIDKETWEIANNIRKSTRSSKILMDENPFKGLIVCADCGKTMRLEKRNNSKKGIFDYRYYCDNPECKHGNSISKAILEEIIRQELSGLKSVILQNKDKFIEYARKIKLEGRVLITDVEKEIAKTKKRCEDIDCSISKLFEQNITKRIPAESYKILLERYKRERTALTVQLTTLEQRRESEKQEYDISASKMIEVLEQIDEENILKATVVRRIIKSIVLQARSKDKNFMHRVINLKIVYFMCNELIKEFSE